METQTRQLREALAGSGWLISRVIPDADLPWWLSELWIIELTWSPAGYQLCIAFKTAPEDLTRIGAAPHEVGLFPVSLVRSDERPPQLASVYLRPHWERELPGFLQQVQKARDDVA